MQVGDPFTEKCLIEACLEAMEQDAIVGIQDMGAAGLTCSSFEMAARGGLGIAIDLDQVPQRDARSPPYEMLLSESQERMLLVPRAGAEHEVIEIFGTWDLDAVVVGRVTDDRMLRVSAAGEDVVDAAGRAARGRRAGVRTPGGGAGRPRASSSASTSARSRCPSDYGETLLRLLDSPNLASKAGSSASTTRWSAATPSSAPAATRAVPAHQGHQQGARAERRLQRRYCCLDPYAGAMTAVAEAARNVACAGAEPLGVTDCLNFGNPEKPEIMWQFGEAVRGLARRVRRARMPVVSGNVCFYNETDGRRDSSDADDRDGRAARRRRATTPPQWFKSDGDVVVLLGRTREELGGSEYLALAARHRGGHAAVDRSGGRAAGATGLPDGHPRRDRAHGARPVGGRPRGGARRSLHLPGRASALGAEIELEAAIRPDACCSARASRASLRVRRTKHVGRLRELARDADVPLRGPRRGARPAVCASAR